jgi:hypothetical protein
MGMRENTIFCTRCGLGLYWTPTPERPLCGDCAERERIANLLVHSAIAQAREDDFLRRSGL